MHLMPHHVSQEKNSQFEKQVYFSLKALFQSGMSLYQWTCKPLCLFKIIAGKRNVLLSIVRDLGSQF